MQKYILNVENYLKDLKFYNNQFDNSFLENKNILITGSTGMIGSYLVDMLMLNAEKLNINIYAMSRSENSFNKRFEIYSNSKNLHLLLGDVVNPIILEVKVDYIFHLASNTHPLQYSQKPIETINTNVIGTNNILNFASQNNVKKIIFTSSVEIYGKETSACETKFAEKDCGYIDCNTLRAGYPEGKRLAESLCQAYVKSKNLNVSILRLSRSYGPTMKLDDSKAMSQFLLNGAHHQDIVLKSKGEQKFSYCYVGDAVLALIKCAQNGVTCDAYNICSFDSDFRLKDICKLISSYSNTNVVFDLPKETEKAGYSTASVALLDISKSKEIGYESKTNLSNGILKTLEILEKLI